VPVRTPKDNVTALMNAAYSYAAMPEKDFF
jgi:hypothetical protein